MKSKEKLTERLKTRGLGYGVRVWGKKACQYHKRITGVIYESYYALCHQL